MNWNQTDISSAFLELCSLLDRILPYNKLVQVNKQSPSQGIILFWPQLATVQIEYLGAYQKVQGFIMEQM